MPLSGFGFVQEGGVWQPILDTLENYAWSVIFQPQGIQPNVGVIPQGSVIGGTTRTPRPVGSRSGGSAGVPKAPEQVDGGWGIEGETSVYTVGGGPVGRRVYRTPGETGGSEPVLVEEHPQGDWLPGSIFAPGRDWGPPHEPTEHGLDKPPPVSNEDDEMAFDWGAATSGFIDILQGQSPGGGAQQSFVGPPYATSTPAPGLPSTAGMTEGQVKAMCGNARYVTLDRKTGSISCRRRRRRRLLTPTDLSDLAALATIVGKGDSLKLAVVKAVRR